MHQVPRLVLLLIFMRYLLALLLLVLTACEPDPHDYDVVYTYSPQYYGDVMIMTPQPIYFHSDACKYCATLKKP
jgi:hypothetical protein